MTLRQAERIYTGRVLNLDLDTVEFPDGSTGELEMIRHPGASAVLPILDAPGQEPQAVLIRQFRHAASDFIYEVPAGRLDPGETPEDCATRELREETGYRAGRLERLTTIYTTPGFTDERIHLFLARDLTAGGVAREHDEFIEPVLMGWSQVIEMVREGRIVDGKSLTAILFVQGFVKLS